MKIQKKIFIVFTISILGFVSIGILANYLLLEKYYMYKSHKEFIEMSQQIQKKVKKNNTNIDKYITRYDKKKNTRIIILNSAFKVEEISYYQRSGNTNIPLKRIKKLSEEKKDNIYICKIYEQKKSSSAKMFFLTVMEDGRYLFFMKNTKKVHESARIANKFYLIIGGLVLIASLCTTAVLSKKITKPVIIINEVTKEMARLNFENKIPENGKDEISELAHSINHMSTQLHNCISLMEQDIDNRKQLIRDLSHELKTPIAVIKGYADGLRYGVADNPDAINKYCGIIADECDNIDKMVKGMLELSQLEQVAVSLKIETIKVYDIITKLSLKYTNMLEQKKCKFIISCEKTTEVTADQKLFERIIDNLFGNAVKYVTDNGKIQITVYETESETYFCIFNTSKPIPKDKIDKIWDAFYKIDNSRKRNNGSHGIGLAIVKAAVSLHHGTVFAENKTEGVVFGCTFPKIIP